MNTFIRFDSHRQRERALRALPQKPQAYWSLRRSCNYGVYSVADTDLPVIAAAAKFRRLRGPYDDLMMCWS